MSCLSATEVILRSLTIRWSELLVEDVLNEVFEHAIGLVRGWGVELGDALHHGLLFGKGMQPAAEIEKLPFGADAVRGRRDRPSALKHNIPLFHRSGFARHRWRGRVLDLEANE